MSEQPKPTVSDLIIAIYEKFKHLNDPIMYASNDSEAPNKILKELWIDVCNARRAVRGEGEI